MSEPETVDQAAEPQSDLWTSDSERGTGTSDPLPSGATDTPLETVLEPEAASADVAATTTERDEAGKFKPKAKGKARTDPQARVEAATAKEAAAKEEARLAREETARYKAELEAARRPAPQPASTAMPMGDHPAFDAWSEQHPGQDWDAYQRSVIRHEAKRETQDALRAHTQQQAIDAKLTAYHQRIAEGKQKYPDLAAMMEAEKSPVDDAMARRGLRAFPDVIAEAIVTSELAPEILRHFGLHPEDAAQLAMDMQAVPVSAASVVRRLLESQVASAAVVSPDSARGVRPSAAKPPVNRVGGTATSTPVDPEDLEFGPEYIRAENAREKKRQEAGRW